MFRKSCPERSQWELAVKIVGWLQQHSSVSALGLAPDHIFINHLGDGTECVCLLNMQMTPCWEGLWGLWRRDENSKNGDVIWIGAGVRYTFRQEWWTAQMWDGECWQLLPGSTFPCGPFSVLQILVAQRVLSAGVVFLSLKFVRALASWGSGLSWTLYSLTRFPYEALRATIGQ